MSILDWRSQVTPDQAADACKLERGKIVMRDPAKISHVMLHQTACWYGVASYQLAAAKGDEVLARHRRALGIHAHITAMRHGSAVVAYDPRAYVNHGHNANEFSVGLEHEGHYTESGEPVEMPGKVDVGPIIEAGREALTWLREQLPNLRVIIAHRQSMRAGGNRRPKTADPGARIFREVGVEHGVKRLGLTIDPVATWGIGRPLPASWYS
jgi:hypothetical protein